MPIYHSILVGNGISLLTPSADGNAGESIIADGSLGLSFATNVVFSGGFIKAGPVSAMPLAPGHFFRDDSGDIARFTRDVVGAAHGDFSIRMAGFQFQLFDVYNDKAMLGLVYHDHGFGDMANIIIGKDSNATVGLDGIIRAPHADSRDVDVVGGDLYVGSGRGTGAAASSQIFFITPDDVASGSGFQAYSIKLVVDSSGNIGIPNDTGLFYSGIAGATDYSWGWDGDDAVHTISAGRFVFTGGPTSNVGTTGGINRRVTEATGTAGAAATFDIEVDIPSGARILGCQLRVDTALTSSDGGVSWTAAYIDGSTAQIGTALAFAQDTKQNTMYNANAANDITSAETDIRVTCDGGKTFAAGGVVRAIVYYEDFTAMANV